MKQAIFLLSLAAAASAYVGELCGNPTAGYGVCENKNTWCGTNAHGGTAKPGYCLSDPEPIECCFNPICLNTVESHGTCFYVPSGDCDLQKSSYEPYVPNLL